MTAANQKKVGYLVEQEVRVALEPVGDTLRLLHLDDTVNVVLELVADHNIGTVALSRVVNGLLSISINGCLHAGVEHVTLGVADEAMGHVNPLDVHVDRVDDAAVDPAMDLVLALGVNDELVVKVLLAGGAADEVCRSVAHGCALSSETHASSLSGLITLPPFAVSSSSILLLPLPVATISHTRTSSQSLIITRAMMSCSSSLDIRTSLLSDPRHFLWRRRNPLGTLHRAYSFKIHGVNLLKCATLAFNDEEVDDESTEDIASSKDVSVAEVNVFGDEGCEEGEQEIPEPVTGGGQSHTLGSVTRREDLSHDGPNHRSPGGRETENEETGKDNHGNTSALGTRRICAIEPMPSKMRVALDLAFCAKLGFDFFHLGVDGPVVGCRAVDFAEGVACAVNLALAVVESRCVGKEENSNAENEGEDPADADDDAPAC
ncbi:hypothetical protein HG531_004567 [Fusarium graminearum]|nr:hypothetical protein HG531_004567 [Fusarium graminearum]